VGAFDYWLKPEWRHSWGGPFNGQEFRQQLFSELCARVPFVAVVETGTFRGTTTRFFHETTRLPVHSFETGSRNYGFARANLRSLSPHVHLYRCDSRTGLTHLATSNRLPPGAVFFYLDAHGAGELPLAEELRLVFAHWPAAVIMIDDFAVPDDPGYGFDQYEPDGPLTLGYLEKNGALPAGIWFPRCPALAETGYRRGCVVLAEDEDVTRLVDSVGRLRRWSLHANSVQGGFGPRASGLGR
jgi:hypothetical protein